MKTFLTFGALLIAASAVLGQGQFLFNSHDPSSGNNVMFVFYGAPATAPDLFVQVFAGPDAAHLQPVSGTLGGPLPLNRPVGKGDGYSNPFSDIYTVPGMAGGSQATVGFLMFQGTSLSTATAQSALNLATSPVVLTEPPTPPNEVALGVQTVFYPIPEPPITALGLLASALAVVMGWHNSSARAGSEKHAVRG